jgi:hypothetical protein
MDRNVTRLTFGILLLGLLLRVLWIDADSNYYNWVGFYADEWRWTEVARYFAHHGTVWINPRNYNTVVAPGFEAATLISYQLFGTGYQAVRIFPAFCGVGMLLVLYLHLRRRASPVGTLCAVSLLATQADLVSLSRLATPEIASMFGGLLTWIAVDAARGRRAALVACGGLLAAILAFKLTSYYLIPAFLLIVFWQRKGEGIKTRFLDMASLGAGLAGPGLIAMFIALSRMDQTDRLLKRIMGLAEFLQHIEFYDLVARPFVAKGAPLMNAALLAAWFARQRWLERPTWAEAYLEEAVASSRSKVGEVYRCRTGSSNITDLVKYGFKKLKIFIYVFSVLERESRRYEGTAHLFRLEPLDRTAVQVGAVSL